VFTMFVLMALFSACFTTPMFYLVYERYMAKHPVKKTEKKGDFWAILCLLDTQVASWMGTVSSLFLHRNENVAVKLVTIKEVSDRPSTLIYAEMTRQKQKYISHDNPLTRNAKTKLTAIGAVVEERSLVTSKPPMGFSDYVLARDFNVVFFELRHSVDIAEEPLLGEKFSPLKHALHFESTGVAMVKQALLKIECPIGVIIDKDIIPEQIEHVLFIWKGGKHEKFALAAMLQMIRADVEVHVTVVTRAEAFMDLFSLKTTRVTVIPTKSEEDVAELTQDKSYDLVVMGAVRDDIDALHSSVAVKACKIPILFLYSSVQDSPDILTGEEGSIELLQVLPE